MMLMKYTIPYYAGIFGPRTGMQILAIATTIRIGIMLVVIFALTLFWWYAIARKQHIVEMKGSKVLSTV